VIEPLNVSMTTDGCAETVNTRCSVAVALTLLALSAAQPFKAGSGSTETANARIRRKRRDSVGFGISDLRYEQHGGSKQNEGTASRFDPDSALLVSDPNNEDGDSWQYLVGADAPGYANTAPFRVYNHRSEHMLTSHAAYDISRYDQY
jgi:hypothetical protein